MGARHNRIMGSAMLLTAIAVGALTVVGRSGVAAQQPPAGQQPPRSGQARAPIDLTGTWVSVITEEWRWRMMTPPKGDVDSIPVTDEARKVTAAWDPAKDAADGNACRAYGAIGVMRLPGRLRIAWQDENTLKIETDAGEQMRLVRFGDNIQRPAADAGWQGFSVARWLAGGGVDLTRVGVRGGGGGGGFGAAGGMGALGRGGTLRVETTNMKAGYIRKNGVPYSDNAILTEYYLTHTTPDGNRWLTVNQIVQDPRYLNGDYVTNWHFKREPNDAKFRPTPCSAS